MELQKIVGENVRQIRKARGWTQGDLAAASGLHRVYISGVERGVRNLTVSVLERLAEALKVSPARLLQRP